MRGSTEIITGLLSDYAHCIDNNELERWPGFFTKKARYFVTTAFNQEKGLPIGIIDASSRKMLEDRVAALRKANIYEPQRYRHIISVVRIIGNDDMLFSVGSSFLVVRTMIDGTQDLFVSGHYEDLIDLSGERPLFVEKRVILDSDKIDTLLAIPI